MFVEAGQISSERFAERPSTRQLTPGWKNSTVLSDFETSRKQCPLYRSWSLFCLPARAHPYHWRRWITLQIGRKLWLTGSWSRGAWVIGYCRPCFIDTFHEEITFSLLRIAGSTSGSQLPWWRKRGPRGSETTHWLSHYAIWTLIGLRQKTMND